MCTHTPANPSANLPASQLLLSSSCVGMVHFKEAATATGAETSRALAHRGTRPALSRVAMPSCLQDAEVHRLRTKLARVEAELESATRLAEQHEQLAQKCAALANGHVHLEAQLEAVLGDMMQSATDFELDTPARCILLMTDQLMSGQVPPPELVARVRTAVVRG